MQIFLLSAYVLLTSSALIVIKLGVQAGRKSFSLLGFNFNYWFILGIIIYGISFLLYIYLISKFDLGFIIPLLAAFVYIFVFAGAFFILHEEFTLLKIAAITLILIGIILLSVSGAGKN